MYPTTPSLFRLMSPSLSHPGESKFFGMKNAGHFYGERLLLFVAVKRNGEADNDDKVAIVKTKDRRFNIRSVTSVKNVAVPLTWIQDVTFSNPECFCAKIGNI
jgi:hypothetical protein